MRRSRYLSRSGPKQMVRWINSPTVMAVLVMLAMLGIYIELNTPGVGLLRPRRRDRDCNHGGGKYLIGMANWLEIAVFAVGVILLAIEIFLIPGFGLTGIAGIILMAAGVLGMLVRNRPDEVPWPRTAFDWQLLLDGLMALSLGFVGFLVAAFALAKYLPRMYFLRGLMLEPAPAGDAMPVSMTAPSAGSGLVSGKSARSSRRCGRSGRLVWDATVDVVAEGNSLKKAAR